MHFFISKDVYKRQIQKCVRHSTGIAFIFVAENGENCIAVAPGANNLLRGERMDTILPVIKEADALVLQLEIPYESVISLIEYAHTVDTKIILNPAPAKQIPSYICLLYTSRCV